MRRSRSCGPLAEREGRELLIEAQLQPNGRNRVLVNRQPLRRARDLLGSLRVSVFTPDDLAIVKDGPGERRRFLDDALVSLHPRNDGLRTEPSTRCCGSATRCSSRRAGGSTSRRRSRSTCGTRSWRRPAPPWSPPRLDLLDRMRPVLTETYDALARRPAAVTARYEAAVARRPTAATRRRRWPRRSPRSRGDDVRRGVSTVGPHRDDVCSRSASGPARTQASQGEQRTLALALRLAVHHVVTAAAGSPPVLLLDDVFSELDPDRSAALLANLPGRARPC